MQFWGDQESERVLRATQIAQGDIQTRLEDAENQLATGLNSAATVAVVTPTDPAIVNLLKNTDIGHSFNSWFEAVAGSGKSAFEIAYFFTHSTAALALLFTSVLTNPGDAVTSAIKSVDHSEFSANINNPKWNREYGTIIFGKTNTIDLPFGSFSPDGASFIDTHPLRAGDPIFLTFKICRKSQYVRPKGRLFAGIYNSKTGYEGWIKGNPYGLSGGRRGAGTPANSVSAQYMIAVEIDQGYALVSEIITIADSPDLASMNIASYNLLSWAYIAGTLRVRIFRKFGAGNVFEIGENPQGQNFYIDKGAVSATDTGSASFPTLTNQKTAIESYWASSETEFRNLLIDGVDSQWSLYLVWIPVVSSVQMNNVEKPALRIGATESAGIRVVDAVCDSTTTVTSIAAQFTAAMNGKAFNLRNPATGVTHSGTVAYVSADTITLSAAAPFTASNCVLDVDDCVDDAYEIDKIGAAFANGIWSPHPEDSSGRPQQAAAQPPASNQGDGSTAPGSSGSGPVYGGTGGSYCVWEKTRIDIRTVYGKPRKKQADKVKRGDFAWFGQTDAQGNYLYNEIESIETHVVDELIEVITASGWLQCTAPHRMISGDINLKDGCPVEDLSVGDILFRFNKAKRKFVAEYIKSRLVKRGKFKVVSFKMKVPRNQHRKTAHLMMCNDYLCHNLKETGIGTPESQV